jgi:PAS domain S-box-containing protein
LQRLDAGQVDAVICTKVFAESIIRNKGLTHLQAAPFELKDVRFQYHLAVLNGQDQLLYELNAGLTAVRSNGVYDDLYEKWISPLEPRKLRWSDFRPYRIPSAVALLVLVAAFWLQRRLLSKIRHQAAALKTSEERLTLVLEGSQDAFWDWDLATNAVTRSEGWSLMLGHPELIGTGMEALDPFIHPDDLTHVRHARDLVQEQGHARAEYRIRDRKGHWLWILDRGKVVARDARGHPTRITGAATDITARKRIEEALGRSQALLEQSQRAAEIGGWEYDAATEQFYWTFQAFRIHDLDPDAGSPTLKQFFSFYNTVPQSILRNAFQTALTVGESFDVELELLTANQRPIWVRTIGRAEKNTTQVIRVYGSFQNITDRKKADEERQKLQTKMQEAQKLESLGVLAGGIAHDFNNLLTVIMGNASIAKEAPGDAPMALQQIETATQRAADLCRQMLAYAGKARIAMDCIDLNNLVADTTHLLRLSISKTATLEFALHPEPLAIEADASQIRQVIMNLVINASDALGSENGTIRVSTDTKQVTSETLQEARLGQELPPGDYVSVEVTDNGCGMSAETIKRIFDPFFTTKFSGRGLGLAAVLGIVRAHRGAFFVESTLGHGATFRMLLPPTSKPLKASKFNSQPKLPTTAKTGTILVVDDEPGVRKLASNILEPQGYTVALASDGYEALALTLAHGARITAVLLDLTMPGLDGPSTLRELRQMKIDIPVLIMSGYSEVDVRSRFPDDSRLSFIPKPFNAEQLSDRLEELLAQTS